MKTYWLRFIAVSVLIWGIPFLARAQWAYQTDITRTKVTIIGYSGPGGDVIIPDTIKGST